MPTLHLRSKGTRLVYEMHLENSLGKLFLERDAIGLYATGSMRVRFLVFVTILAYLNSDYDMHVEHLYSYIIESLRETQTEAAGDRRKDAIIKQLNASNLALAKELIGKRAID